MGGNHWGFALIACFLCIASPARLANAQVKITPDTLKVEIGERLVLRWFHMDMSPIPPDARSIRMEFPPGIDVQVLGTGGDETRSCGIPHRSAQGEAHPYAEWEKPARITGPWLGYPRCTLGLTLQDVHGRTAVFPISVTRQDGSTSKAGSMRLVIIGPGRSTWWMWVLAVVVALVVIVAVLRRPSEDGG